MSAEHKVLRGMFSGAELENLLWGASWLNWESRKGNDLSFSYVSPKASELSIDLREAFSKLGKVILTHDYDVFFWAEKHSEGDYCKISYPEFSRVVMMLSISQYRGGRTHLGGFRGYINPGEVVLATLAEEQNNYQVEKVNSGERIVLCVGGRRK